jgi:hypothetical protein
VTFLADVPEPNGENGVFDAVHIETLVVAGCDVFNAQLAQQLQQAKVSNRVAFAISHIPIPNSNPNDIFSLFSRSLVPTPTSSRILSQCKRTKGFGGRVCA